MKITNEELIESLQQFYKEEGRSPIATECSKFEYLKGKGTYINRFGGFGEALEAAGLPRNKKKAKILSDLELLQTLKEYYSKYNKLPSQNLCNGSSILASHTTYVKRFGSFTKALRAAGLEDKLNHNHKIASEKELLDSLIKFFKEFNRPPVTEDFKKFDYLYSTGTYVNHFGSIKTAYKKAGISKLTNKLFAHEIDENNLLLDNLLKFYKENGRAPSQEECATIGYLNSWGTYYYRFGSLSKALASLGIEKTSGVSIGELQLRNFIKEVYKGPIICSDRSTLKWNRELDIYLPELKLAFEYDGLYWHSESIKPDKNYHLNKTIEAENKGVRLIHIFESEWKLKQEIVESRIKNLLGTNKVIYARKCKIKEVNTKDARNFLGSSHIQGFVGSSIKIGLYYKDELVALMTFSKSRFSNKYEYELARYCNKLNTSVVGGASKLFKFFIKEYKPNSVVSYADLRWNTGELYTKLGFELSHISNPNYWYFKNLELESRLKYQKHKLKSLLNEFNPKLTEYENMLANGYKRIFDCGNKVFVWTKSSSN